MEDEGEPSMAFEEAAACNEHPIVCSTCNTEILPPQSAKKTRKKVYLMQNHGRGYDMTGTYWYVDNFHKFSNIMVHSANKSVKYLTCVNCGSSICGYQLGNDIKQNYVLCSRVKEFKFSQE